MRPFESFDRLRMRGATDGMPRPNPLTPEVQRAFLDSIRGGALVVAAAASAGVPLGTLYERRKRDPLFDLAWSAAAELSVEWRWDPAAGRRVRAAGFRRRLRFSERRRAAYLRVLGQSCDSGRAARETGVDLRTVYRRLRCDSGFARETREALERGFARLHASLESERAGQEARIRAGDLALRIEPTGEMTRDFDRQMLLLQRYGRTDGSIGSRRVRPGFQRPMRFEDAIILLDRKLRGLGLVADKPVAERMRDAEAAAGDGQAGGRDASFREGTRKPGPRGGPPSLSDLRSRLSGSHQSSTLMGSLPG